MIKKIHLEDFMAHQATSIELSPGVTVITGPNNIGKSAIVEAIRHLVYNPAPKNVIRHGAKRAVVRLELDSGESIVWQRQPKTAAYRIEQDDQAAEEYHKFGQKVPEDVRERLRLDQVETDSDAIDIHLGNQREPIFLLNRPGSHAAGFFAASTEADYLLKMQQALKQRTVAANQAQKRLALELVELAQQLALYEPLDNLERGLLRAEADWGLIQSARQQLPRLAEAIRQLAEVLQQLGWANGRGRVLAGLAPPPVWEDLAGLARLTAELENALDQQNEEQTRQRILGELNLPPVLTATAGLEAWLTDCLASLALYEHTQARGQALADLAGPPALAATQDLAGVIQALEQGAAHHVRARQRLVAATPLEGPPVLADTGELPGLIRELGGLAVRVETSRRRQVGLAGLVSPPEVAEVGHLEELVRELARQEEACWLRKERSRRLAGLLPPPEAQATASLEEAVQVLEKVAGDLRQHQVRLDGLTLRLEQKTAEIQAFFQGTGACPLCGNPLSLDHFLEGGHV